MADQNTPQAIACQAIAKARPDFLEVATCLPPAAEPQIPPELRKEYDSLADAPGSRICCGPIDRRHASTPIRCHGLIWPGYPRVTQDLWPRSRRVIAMCARY